MREKKEKENERINMPNLNRCINEYKKLAYLLSNLVIIIMICLAIYILNKLHIFAFIKEFFKILIPLFIGLVISWILAPGVDKLVKRKVPRVLACIIVYLIMLSIIFVILALVIPNLMNQIKDLIAAMPNILNELKDIIDDLFGNTNSSEIRNIKKNIFKAMGDFSESITVDLPSTVIGGTKSFISVMTTLILGLMISFYLSYDYHKMSKKMYNLIPKKYHPNTKDLTGRINSSLRSYIQGVLIVMLLVFVSQAIGLTIAGLKAPLIFALFCAITDIIPYFGPWIGAVPAIIVGFTISPLTGIFTIISIIIVQTLENNFYQPLIMGHTMELHPVTIMLGLLIFGNFFGMIGMIFATPLVAILKIICTFINEKVHILDRIKAKMSCFE